MLEKEISNLLSQWVDPYLKKNWVTGTCLKNIAQRDDYILLTIELGYPYQGLESVYQSEIKQLLKPVLGDKNLKIDFQLKIAAHGTKNGTTPSTVKNLIAVASGKGGVGKSTVALYLALTLNKLGARVGLLDADIYGPSQPVMLGTQHSKPLIENRKINPLNKGGMQTISIGNLVASDVAMVWRGPMLGKALEQLMYDTKWEALDYLIVDLPPGTGDVQLTLCQKMSVSGAVLVTTPQELALADVRRAAAMFQKLTIPILGVVENMSNYRCNHCGHEETLFGEGGGRQLAASIPCDLLGEIPLEKKIREQSDQGAATPDSPLFIELARKIAGKVATLPKDYSRKFPKIVVEQ